jgi:hypothetical protein
MLDFDWDNIDDTADKDDDLLADPALLAVLVPLPEWPPYIDPDLPAPSQVDDPENAVPIPSTLPPEPTVEEEEANFFANSNHTILKASLIKHITYAYTNGQLHWPKTFTEYQKKKLPLMQRVLSRTEATLRSRLLIRPSELRRFNSRTGLYDLPIGNGLFSKEFIRGGTQIVHFNGTELPNREAVQRAKAQSDRGGYVISNLTETYGIDCYDNASRLQCFASLANSPYKCHNVTRNVTPRANVRKSIATVDGRCVFGLIAAVDIQPFTEILVNYGPGYIFPSHYE